jgi:hypothetical protein
MDTGWIYGIRLPWWGWEYSFLLTNSPSDFGEKNTFNIHRQFYEVSCMLLNKEFVTGVSLLHCIV